MSKTYEYQVQHIAPLTDTVIQLTAVPAADEQLHYLAGQYLSIDDGSGDARPFSIANAPLGTQQLEFHIRHSSENTFTQQLFNNIKQHGKITLTAAGGECIYHEDREHPLLFLAAGTGFAPMKALIEHALASDQIRPMHLFWGAKSPSDLYLDKLPLQWAKHIEHFHYTPVLPQFPTEDEQWQGTIGLIQDAVIKQYSDLSKHHVYIAGSPDMAHAIVNTLNKHGLQKEHLFCDVL